MTFIQVVITTVDGKNYSLRKTDKLCGIPVSEVLDNFSIVESMMRNNENIITVESNVSKYVFNKTNVISIKSVDNSVQGVIV